MVSSGGVLDLATSAVGKIESEAEVTGVKRIS